MSGGNRVSDDFVGFINTYKDVPDGETFAEFLFAWLTRGNAVLESGGDYGTYMTAVLYSYERYIEDPSILDYTGSETRIPAPGVSRIRRRADGLVGAGHLYEMFGGGALDKDFFNRIYAHRLAGVPIIYT